MVEGSIRLWKGATEEKQMGLWGGAIDSSAKRHCMPVMGNRDRMGDGSIVPCFRLQLDRREEEFDLLSEDMSTAFGVG